MSKQPNPKPKPKPKMQENSGEGNREADRQYREAATRHAQSGRSDEAGHKASEALDDEEEAAKLKEAEAAGKSRARTTHDQRGEPF